jgi:diguanylate cyclase
MLLYFAVAGLAAVGTITLLGAGAGVGLVPVIVITGIVALTLAVRTRAAMDEALNEGGGSLSVDPTTGTATAIAGREALQREFAAAQRGRPLTIALIRLEEMGLYSAEHGKAVAEQLLRDAGRVLAQHRRGMHVVAQYGREPGTFLAVLSGVDGEGGAVYGTRVRRSLAAIPRLPHPVAINVGVAVFDRSMVSPKELLKRAEFALGKGSKAGGKVIVVGEGRD